MSNLKIAIEDYRYLKNRDFPDKASLKLIGDRYRLSRLERNCLFRGVVPSSVSKKRKNKLVDPQQVRGAELGMDWYNVIITLESYLKGLPVFLSDDGILRDATGVHGSYRVGKVTDRALTLILISFTELKPGRVDIYLDAPVAFSGSTAAELRERMASFRNWEVTVLHSPDYILKSYSGIVASSDSIIIDRAERILDFPRYILENHFDFDPPDLLSLNVG